ncbi:hypothetical protein ACWF94_13310 [Streptomyces sp. NPDC055078]
MESTIQEFRILEKMQDRCRTRGWPEEWAEDFAKSWAQGYLQGYVQGRSESILLLLEARGVDITDDAREHITGCGDLDTVRRWQTRAVTATTAEDIFTEE